MGTYERQKFAVLVAALLIATISAPVTFADGGGTALGDEFEVFPGGTGALAGIASNADGGFVIGAAGSRESDTCVGSCIQLYAADGTPRTPPFSFTIPGALSPPVWAMNAQGLFAVVWVTRIADFQAQIYQQRFAADGTAIGSPVKVHVCDGNTCNVAVATNSSGGAVIVWFEGLLFEYPPIPVFTSFRIGAQAYAADNTAIGSVQRVVASTCIDGRYSLCSHPELNSSDRALVAMDDTGRYIVTWGQAGYFLGRIYSSNGIAGPRFRLGLGYQDNDLALAMNAVGDIRIASGGCVDYTCSQRGVLERRYTGSGMAQGPLGLVYDDGSNTGEPSIAVDPQGDFVVTWSMYDQVGSCGTASPQPSIYAQRFDANGEALGSCFRVNAPTDDTGSNPKVTMDAAGNFVIAWEGYSSQSPYAAIKARRYSGP